MKSKCVVWERLGDSKKGGGFRVHAAPLQVGFGLREDLNELHILAFFNSSIVFDSLSFEHELYIQLGLTTEASS